MFCHLYEIQQLKGRYITADPDVDATYQIVTMGTKVAAGQDHQSDQRIPHEELAHIGFVVGAHSVVYLAESLKRLCKSLYSI